MGRRLLSLHTRPRSKVVTAVFFQIVISRLRIKSWRGHSWSRTFWVENYYQRASQKEKRAYGELKGSFWPRVMLGVRSQGTDVAGNMEDTNSKGFLRTIKELDLYPEVIREQ